jgi:hypothetical protein
VFVLAVTIGAAASAAFGQQQPPPPHSVERFERTLEQIRRETIDGPLGAVPPEQRALFNYGAYVSLGYYSIDDRDHESHILRQYEVFPYVRLNLDGAHEFFVRGRLGYRDFNDGDSFDGRGDEPIDGDVDRAYYRFNAGGDRNGRAAGLSVQAGRDLVYWANGLTLAQTLDGVAVRWASADVSVELLGGVTATRTVDYDSSRPAFDYNTRRGFFGAMASGRRGAHRPYVYALAQSDFNRDEVLRVQTGSGPENRIDTRFEYNSYYVGFGSAGTLGDRLTYGTEFVVEFGRGLSNSFEAGAGGPTPVRQRNESILAFAIDARADYLLPDAARTRLSGELIVASGDRDRDSTSNTFGGNRRGTADHAFNGFGLVNTGLAFAPPASNLLVVRLGATGFPMASAGAPWNRLQVGADFFAFAKLSAGAPIDEPTSDDHYLGFEPDAFLNWQVTSDVSLAVRYGVFFPGSAVVADDRPRQVFFLGVTYAF